MKRRGREVYAREDGIGVRMAVMGGDFRVTENAEVRKKLGEVLKTYARTMKRVVEKSWG